MKYECTDEKHNISRGEIHFKWNDKAQWFNIKRISDNK